MDINWGYHIHSNYTHGENTIDEIASYCKDLGLLEISITEHIRKKPSYQFEKLQHDIHLAIKKYNLNIFTGIETKILLDGSLDSPKKFLSQVDVVIGSVHKWSEKKSLFHAYELLVISPVTIIGHPQIVNEEIVQLCIKHKKVLEISYKYQLNDRQFTLINQSPRLRITFGIDAHRLEDIKYALDYFQYVLLKYKFSHQLWKIGEVV